eukprot:3452475-Prymnesium_polylepis.2
MCWGGSWSLGGACAACTGNVTSRETLARYEALQRRARQQRATTGKRGSWPPGTHAVLAHQSTTRQSRASSVVRAQRCQ